MGIRLIIHDCKRERERERKILEAEGSRFSGSMVARERRISRPLESLNRPSEAKRVREAV